MVNLSLPLKPKQTNNFIFLQVNPNTETRSFEINANANNPTNNASIAINTPNGSSSSSSSIHVSGPGATAYSSSTISHSNGGSNPGRATNGDALGNTNTLNSANNTTDSTNQPTSVPASNDPTPQASNTESTASSDAVDNLINKLRDITYSIQPQVTETTSNLLTNNVQWTSLNIKGIDISSSSLQELYVVGMDNNIYLYNPLFNSTSIVLDGNKYMRVITKNKQLFAITTNNTISYVKGNNIYNFESCTNDLAVTELGEIYKLGCDRSNIYPLFKLQCRFLSKSYSKLLDTVIGRPGITCEWVYKNIKATKLAVGAFGLLYTINQDSHVELHVDDQTKVISDLLVRDLTLSNDGSLYVVDMNSVLYILNPSDGKTTKIAENVLTVTAGPINMPIYIDTSNNIFISRQVVEFLNQ
jgi:hypothetical protein